jgi:hypothetical protein
MRKKNILLCLIFSFFGCTTRHGDFTVLSNKLIRVSNFKADSQNRTHVQGKDINHIIVVFPTGGTPTIEGALDDAFKKGNGDLMTDAVISHSWFYIPYIYGQGGWTIEGDVVKTRK